MKNHQKLTLLFWHRKSKADKNGYAPVICRISIEGEPESEIATSKKVHLNEWCTANKKAKGSSTEARETNLKILEMTVDLNRHFTVLQVANKIMAGAQALFVQQHDFCLMVHVDFRCDYGLAVSDPVQLFNSDIKPLSIFLADFVGAKLPEIGQLDVGDSLHYETYDRETLDKVLPDKINGIRVYNTKTHREALWSAYQGAAIPGIFDSDEFREAMDKKNGKPKGYEKDYEEIWLLMVEESMDLTSYFHFDDQVAKEITTPFDRVFILRRAENTIHELPKKA